MRYPKLLAIAVLAGCALCVALSVSAFGALPTVLPETIKTWTGKSIGSAPLPEGAGGKKINCESYKAEGTVEQPKALGLFHLHFEKCSTTVLGSKGECTGLSDEKESILWLGSWHLVYDSLSPLGVALLFLFDNVHFTCTVLGVTALILVPLGSMVLCLVTNPTTLQTTFEFKCKSQATGVAQESKYYNETGTLVSIHRLEIAENEKTTEEAVEIISGKTTYPEATLLMI